MTAACHNDCVMLQVPECEPFENVDLFEEKDMTVITTIVPR
jgi:hypothetical protein